MGRFEPDETNIYSYINGHLIAPPQTAPFMALVFLMMMLMMKMIDGEGPRTMGPRHQS